MNAAYFQAAEPEPFRILGQRLKPLSLGRYRLLRRVDCAFVSEAEASASPGDLIIGIVVCAHTCKELRDFMASGRFEKEIKAWSRRISPLPFLGLLPIIGKWWRKWFSFDLFEKYRLFKAYIDAGQAMPKYWLEDESQKDSTLHWSHSLEITLRSQLGWTDEDIEELPLSKAFADSLGYAEANGRIRLITEDEEKMGDANAKALAKLFNN